ncbi:MAG: hypothetical protein ACXVHL_35640 [Solirubrobacteraceae bacterium]
MDEGATGSAFCAVSRVPHRQAPAFFEAELALREMGTPSLLIALDYLDCSRR